MLPFLKLIRLPNLLIMAFTQYMVRWCLLIPLIQLKSHDLDFSLLEVQMTELDFFLLVLSTVMIGAAGYIINDYFDIRIDEVNRPETNLVGKGVKRRVAMAAHMTINIIAVMIGVYLSWKYNLLRVGTLIYVTVPALLWFYSTNLKRRFLIGNFVIALLSGIVPLMVVLFEIPNIYRAFPELVQGGFLQLTDVLHTTLAISLFAFIISLLREIIKDVEDYEGDFEYGCKTMPIVIGIAKTKKIMVGICGVVIGLIGWLQYRQISGGTVLPENFGDNDSIHNAWIFSIPFYLYSFFLIQLPLIYLSIRLLTAKGKSDWRMASLLVKIVMVAGVSYLFLYGHGMHRIILENL
jgi:4-hydroxybenzoate polyprenyltransferase